MEWITDVWVGKWGSGPHIKHMAHLLTKLVSPKTEMVEKPPHNLFMYVAVCYLKSPSSNYVSGSAVCYKYEEVAIKSSVSFYFRVTKIPFLKSFSRAVCLVCDRDLERVDQFIIAPISLGLGGRGGGMKMAGEHVSGVGCMGCMQCGSSL